MELRLMIKFFAEPVKIGGAGLINAFQREWQPALDSDLHQNSTSFESKIGLFIYIRLIFLTL
jgi:hypothetical protein